MAGIKIADVAKKLGSNEEETKQKITNGGFKIADDNTVGDEAVKALGIDPQHLRLDRRQEMLKKAMERHKRHPRSREVKVGSGDEPSAPKKISKQELMDRKKKLENTIRKVDEHRETMKDEQMNDTPSPAVEKSSAPEKTETVKQETVKTAAQQSETAESSAKTETKETVTPQTQTEQKQEVRPKPQQPAGERRPQGDRDNRPQGDRPAYNRDNRPQGDRPPYNRDNRQQGDRPPYNRDNRTQGDRPPYNRDNRPQGDRPPYNRDNRTQGDRPPYNRDNRTQGDRPPYNRDNRQQGDRPPYNRDNRTQGDRPPYNRDNRTQGDRPPYNRDNRTQGDRPPYNRDNHTQGDRPPYRPQGDRPSRPKPGLDEGGALAPEKKKVLKDKPKAAPVEAKKVKAPVQKKEKNIHKGMDEGIELFELEREILQSDTQTDVAAEYKEIPVETEVKKVVEKKPQYDNRRRGGRKQKGKRREEKPEPIIIRPSSVVVGENIVVSELAKLMGVKATELIKKLMLMGVMASVNQAIDADTAVLLGGEYGIEVKVKFLTEDDLIPVHDDKEEELTSRPPIVTVMGHVDHGKTSLLDRIRQTAVAEGEAGGITQHIGAYEVKMEKGTITFLDTPGHEAFTTLRARGASVTDVVILVVAADDGVMPQTKEAIDHAKAAGVKLIVAINKIDKENANPDMVRNQLAEHGVISEDWGGDYQFQEISAKANLHIEDLLERVLLEAELLELKGNPTALAEGIVIESKLDKQKGAVATVLINRGTLNKGDNFVVGTEFGKVRAMFNYKGASIKEAGLSVPVEIMGFSGVPQSGDRFVVTPDEKTARQVADLRSDEARKKNFAEKSAVSLADLFNKIKEGELKELNIVLKADVQGSLEALKSSLIKLSNPEVKINIISNGVGGISENDVILASASNAVVIGFNVRPGVQARVKAEQEGIELNLYSVIYQAIDDVKQAMEGMLDPSSREEVIGRAEIRQIFSVPKIGKIAGSYVTDGKVQRNAHVRVVRNSIVIYDGVLSSLKRFTDDVKEVATGYECGIGIDKYNDLKDGDSFEFYVMVEEKRTLEDVRKDAEKKEKAEAAEAEAGE
ncbi:translation initiation factor IF-2 [Denitrovibrio acetiphilus DSM 12809]|uniref:Translation initiation factor IF-2 n=1 Tax=Denitrovibrio acetiphilus (strain DSM 12809 / NBRC 114555 / N2460) TaxID=522772 RepID=D4H7W9_DENA2|nr:translation initiation factor IF-2 [Denitrovibrio acetiphilus]ADD68118.1 translation initiation factor IF-2 [Denitrovibrio acetiphilus DSM 12809]